MGPQSVESGSGPNLYALLPVHRRGNLVEFVRIRMSSKGEREKDGWISFLDAAGRR